MHKTAGYYARAVRWFKGASFLTPDYHSSAKAAASTGAGMD
jgi:hypothetical protein